MSWLEKLLPPKILKSDPADRRSVPEGLWIKCPSCETVLYKTDLEQSQNVCPSCSHHLRIGARARLNSFLDAEGRYEIGQEVLPVDALKFKDSRKYTERLKEALENTGVNGLGSPSGSVNGADASLVAAEVVKVGLGATAHTRDDYNNSNSVTGPDASISAQMVVQAALGTGSQYTGPFCP